MTTAPSGTGSIESVLNEARTFAPSTAKALGFDRWHISSLDEYRKLHERSIKDPEGFWGEEPKPLDWFTPWSRVLDWKAPDAKWFVGATLNACYNCVDRHVKSGHGDDVALIWEGEPILPITSHGIRTDNYAKGPEVNKLTYADLQQETSRLGNALKALGVKKGDVVTIYMPMIPELAVAVLACARIGAVHSVIFGGFAPHAIVERITDANSKVIITADGGFRRGDIVKLKHNVDEACATLAQNGNPVRSVLCVKHADNHVAWDHSRDLWWHDLMISSSPDCSCEPMDSEDMLFLLYTSGSTGKPKGIIHTTGGYLLYT